MKDDHLNFTISYHGASSRRATMVRFRKYNVVWPDMCELKYFVTIKQCNNKAVPMLFARVIHSMMDFVSFSRIYMFADSSRVLTIVVSIFLIVYGCFRWVFFRFHVLSLTSYTKFYVRDFKKKDDGSAYRVWPVSLYCTDVLKIECRVKTFSQNLNYQRRTEFTILNSNYYSVRRAFTSKIMCYVYSIIVLIHR